MGRIFDQGKKGKEGDGLEEDKEEHLKEDKYWVCLVWGGGVGLEAGWSSRRTKRNARIRKSETSRLS